MSINSTSQFRQLEIRPYQVQAWKDMRRFTKQWISDTISHDDKAKRRVLMNICMATGSGKTPTTGIHIRNIFKGRDALERMKNTAIPLNILVLNDRVTLIDQLKSAYIDGKDGFEPLFGANILNHAQVYVNHNKSDDTLDNSTQSAKDAIYFSTIQSIDKVVEQGVNFDIIMIDEAHHMSSESYQSALDHFTQSYKATHDREPLIIAMTATPGIYNQNPVVDFTLPRYLASEYSPEVSYHMITSSDFTAQDVENINTEIKRIKQITDPVAKHKELKKLKELTEEGFAKFGGLDELCADMIDRVTNASGSVDNTMIFANSIEEADHIVSKLNSIYGDDDTAVAFHSKVDELDNTILTGFQNGKHKFIVAVDKLNEGIDMPSVRNVVFWRGTDSHTIFQQQFGRGLRGDYIDIFDYTGRIRNFAMVNDIDTRSQQIYAEQNQAEQIDTGDNEITDNPSSHPNPHTRKRVGINILFGDINNTVLSHEVQLGSIITQINNIETYESYADLDTQELHDLMRSQLTEHKIFTTKDLLDCGSTKFKQQFGLSLIGNILGRNIKTITINDLKELATILELISFDPNLELKSKLAEYHINSASELMNFGPTKFRDIFGSSLIGKILLRTVNFVTVSDLKELAQMLKLPQISELQKQKFRDHLGNNNPSITSSSQLLDFGVRRFQKIFGRVFIGQILGKVIRTISVSDLEEFAQVLDLPKVSEQQKGEFRDILVKNEPSITSTSQLLSFGAKNFQRVFGYSLIGQILGRKSRASINDLKELASILGLEELDHKQTMITELAQQEIITTQNLLDLGPAKFQQQFGASLIGNILGRTVYGVTLNDLKELASILGLKERDLEQTMLKQLKEQEIITTQNLLDLGPAKFQQQFGRSLIGKILGRTIYKLTLNDLKELGDILFGEGA